jgi:alpha-tubulin suppressor-like RCC1 family protein
VQVEALKHLNMGKVAAGDFHCLALTFDMEGLYAWGRSCEGQLGLGSDPQYTTSGANVPTPTRVVFYDRTSTLLVTDIACGQFHSMAKSADGDVYTWGNADGKVFLGTGHRAPEKRHIYIPIKLEMRVKDIDEELESIQMAGGNNISLFLVQGRADPPE